MREEFWVVVLIIGFVGGMMLLAMPTRYEKLGEGHIVAINDIRIESNTLTASLSDGDSHGVFMSLANGEETRIYYIHEFPDVIDPNLSYAVYRKYNLFGYPFGLVLGDCDGD